MEGLQFDVNDAHARRVLAVEVGCDPRTIIRVLTGDGASLAIRRAVHAAMVRLGYAAPPALVGAISSVPRPSL